MDDRSNLGGNREEELPEHETRPEGNEGGGMTTLGISAEQRGPVDREVLEAREGEDEIEADPTTRHRRS